jgi:hypothetical protein
MTTKDDAQFSEAYRNVDKREVLLKQLIKQRRLIGLVSVFLVFAIGFNVTVQLIAQTDLSINPALSFGCMMLMFHLYQLDTKIKILLVSK